MNPFALLAPFFLIFEIWQLVISERYMGIKQIKVNADPRELPMSNRIAMFWAGGLACYLVWMLLLLLHPVGRTEGVILLVITGLGYAVRSTCGIKLILVVLTFEGAVRVGMLVSVIGQSWRSLRNM